MLSVVAHAAAACSRISSTVLYTPYYTVKYGSMQIAVFRIMPDSGCDFFRASQARPRAPNLRVFWNLGRPKLKSDEGCGTLFRSYEMTVRNRCRMKYGTLFIIGYAQ